MVKLLFLKFIAQVTFDFVAKKNKLCFNFHYSSHYNPLLLLLLKGGERERERESKEEGVGKEGWEAAYMHMRLREERASLPPMGVLLYVCTSVRLLLLHTV